MLVLPMASVGEETFLAHAQNLGDYGRQEQVRQAKPFEPFWQGWERTGALSWLFSHHVLPLDKDHRELWSGADYEVVVGKHACGVAKETPYESLEILGFSTSGMKAAPAAVRLHRSGRIPHRQEGYDITIYDAIAVMKQLKTAQLPMLRAVFAPEYAVLRCTPAATLLRRWRRLFWTRQTALAYVREAISRIRKVREAGGERYQLFTALLLLLELRAILVAEEADILEDRDLLLWARDESDIFKVLALTESVRAEVVYRFREAKLAEKLNENSCHRLTLAMLIRNHGPFSNAMRQILGTEDIEGAEALATSV